MQNRGTFLHFCWQRARGVSFYNNLYFDTHSLCDIVTPKFHRMVKNGMKGHVIPRSDIAWIRIT